MADKNRITEDKGYSEARKLINKLRSQTYRKLNDDELYEFRKEMIDHLGGVLKESVKEGFFDRKRSKKDVEDILNKLKIHFQIAYESGLEALGSYKDFDKEFWKGHKRDLMSAIEKAIK